MFWGEAIICAAYIRNQCPFSVINNATPYELWYDRLPTVQHFRDFGSKCYALILKQQQNILGARSQKSIFLGYFNTSKAYKLYDEENKKFILSRDVIFLESDKDNSTIDRQLAHLEKLASKKLYFESDSYDPHTEGGVPILDQFVVFPSLTHENERMLLLKKIWRIMLFLQGQKVFLKNLYFKMSNHHNHFNNLYKGLHVLEKFQASMMILKHECLLKVIHVMFLMTVNSIIVQLANPVVLKKMLIVMN